MNKVQSYIGGKRQTAKGYALMQHPDFGKCALLCQEIHGSYGMFGGGINKNEFPNEGLIREFIEELGANHSLIIKEKVSIIETKSSLHHIFVVELGGNLVPKANEIQGFCFYPLEEGYDTERKLLENNMDYNAIVAMQNLRENNNYMKYPISTFSIKNRFLKRFKKDLAEVLKGI